LFRDGVGDGQLQFSAAHEAAQFLSAFQALSPPFEPKFTMVVVQKRINTRLFHNSVSFVLLLFCFLVLTELVYLFFSYREVQ
jgi:hypothetical protein